MPVLLGASYFVFVGGGTVRRRLASVALGVSIPVLLLVGYTFVATGHAFNPAYEHLYRQEVDAYPELGYVGDWSIEDPRYVPQNLAIMLLQPPNLLPACTPPDAARGLFDPDCPILIRTRSA
jgi:hypothetical protein